MKFLIDMNLSPRWVEVFMVAGLEATHWSAIGDPRATDRSIMEWARREGGRVLVGVTDAALVQGGTAAKESRKSATAFCAASRTTNNEQRTTYLTFWGIVHTLRTYIARCS